MMAKDIEIERPFKHRPGVLVVKRDGVRHVLGDGASFSPQEIAALYDVVKLTRQDRKSMRNFGLNPRDPKDVEKWLRRNDDLI